MILALFFLGHKY